MLNKTLNEYLFRVMSQHGTYGNNPSVFRHRGQIVTSVLVSTDVPDDEDDEQDDEDNGYDDENNHPDLEANICGSDFCADRHVGLTVEACKHNIQSLESDFGFCTIFHLAIV